MGILISAKALLCGAVDAALITTPKVAPAAVAPMVLGTWSGFSVAEVAAARTMEQLLCLRGSMGIVSFS